jgi:hypothetical protein
VPGSGLGGGADGWKFSDAPGKIQHPEQDFADASHRGGVKGVVRDQGILPIDIQRALTLPYALPDGCKGGRGETLQGFRDFVCADYEDGAVRTCA